jgi:hypothetical protein
MLEACAKRKVPPLRSLRFAPVGMTGLFFDLLASSLLTNTSLKRPNSTDLAGTLPG